jgi:hypothetical protein
MEDALAVVPNMAFGPLYGGRDRVIFWEGLLAVCLALGVAACIAVARDRWQKMRVA